MLQLFRTLRSMDPELPLLHKNRRIILSGSFKMDRFGDKKLKYFCFNDVFLYCLKRDSSHKHIYLNFFPIDENLDLLQEGRIVKWMYPNLENNLSMYSFMLKLKSREKAEILVEKVNKIALEDTDFNNSNFFMDMIDAMNLHCPVFLENKLSQSKSYASLRGKTICFYKKKNERQPFHVLDLEKIEKVSLHNNKMIFTDTDNIETIFSVKNSIKAEYFREGLLKILQWHHPAHK